MVLSNSGSLFQQTGLLNDDGLINERWNQPGSTLLNLVDVSVGANTTLYTVTAGRTVYIKSITINSLSAMGAGDAIGISDNATQKMKISLENSAAGDTKIIDLSIPLSFSTSVNLVEFGTISCSVTMSGWEE